MLLVRIRLLENISSILHPNEINFKYTVISRSDLPKDTRNRRRVKKIL
jgi:hypothetical protein